MTAATPVWKQRFYEWCDRIDPYDFMSPHLKKMLEAAFQEAWHASYNEHVRGPQK